jgi:hypothetical protein
VRQAVTRPTRTEVASALPFYPDSDGIAERDRAVGDNARIDAEIRVTPGALQLRRDRHVALARLRVDVGRRAALRALEHLERHGPQPQGLARPIELLPRLSPIDDDIGPEAQRVHCVADGALQFAHRSKIDDV